MANRTSVATAALAAVLAAGCGGTLEVERDLDLTTPGLPSWVTGDMEALKTRTIIAADAAAHVWGGSPRDLDGWKIVYTLNIPCDSANGCNGYAEKGYFRGGTIWINVQHDPSYACPEQMAIGHEVGHAVIGDWGHSSGLWHSYLFASVMGATLAEGVPAEDTECLGMLHPPQIVGLGGVY